MLSDEETRIWREGYDLHVQYRDQLETPEKWMEFSEAVRDFVNRHNMGPVAFRMGVFLMDMMEDQYRDGHRPEPVQTAFFDEEAYT
jgi:hypothetical protein